MFPANITRAEAAQRAQLIQNVSYEVCVDVTVPTALKAGKNPQEQFLSTTLIKFDAKAGDSFVNLIADAVIQLKLDDKYGFRVSF